MIGQQFGNYKALSLLGEGGMGAVYLAEHPGIGRRVAVKVLHREYTSDEQLLGRLLNEARAANAIRHPNIIEILDSGMRPDGTPFLVMELLEGESLGARIRRIGKLPLREAIEFTYQTASALGAAHKKGIVHRDLKPDNLYVCTDPHGLAPEKIKVLDFGIAKLQQPQPGDSVKTRTGTLMGTPIYMSPEQCRGTRSVDHRSDIYSLGVIFFEMLVGHPPFMSEGFGELVNMHLNVPPPSARAARPEIPDALDALVLKMLSKNPEQRYADMTALQGALKLVGGTKLMVQGSSSPDILNATTAPRENTDEPPRMAQTHDTTFTTGMGERQSLIVERRGGKVVATVLAVAALGGAVAWFAYNKGGAAPAAPVAGTPAPTPAPEPPPERKAPPPVPVEVTLRVTSMPDGAKVLDVAGGNVLGLTPLSFKRPRGGALKLRLEKDGYVTAAQDVALDGDQQLEFALAKQERAPDKEKEKPKGVSHAKHHPHGGGEDEPAKL